MRDANKSVLPATSTVTANGLVYTAHNDVFTVGAGSLDIGVWHGRARLRAWFGEGLEADGQVRSESMTDGTGSERIDRLRYAFLMKAIQRNNVNVIGSGEQVLMFAHGYGCDQNMWRYVTPEFSDKYRIVLFDFVGSGLSATSAFDRTRYSTLRGYAQDVLEILEELQLEGVHFVGHSVSSMIGALASIQQPTRFATLTMIGPSASYINDGDYHGGFERADIEGLLDALETNHTAWSAMMAPTIMGNSDRPELGAELEASFCRMDPLLAHHFAKVTFLSDNRADLPLVRTKTLILQCQRDAIADLRVGEYVHQCLPESQFVVMDATGHCPHMSAPKQVAQTMKQFLG